MEIDGALHRIRDYYWGCIYVNDEEDGDFDPDSMVGPGPVWPSHCWVSIQVRHARLVAEEDADVELVVDIRGEAAENPYSWWSTFKTDLCATLQSTSSR